MYILERLLAIITACTGSCAVVLLILYSSKASDKGWLWTGLLYICLIMLVISFEPGIFRQENPTDTIQILDSSYDRSQYIFMQTFGSFSVCLLLFIFPAVLYNNHCIGKPLYRLAFIVASLMAVMQTVINIYTFTNPEQESFPQWISMGTIFFFILIALYLFTLFFTHKKGSIVFQTFIRGSSPFLFFILPFLLLDTISSIQMNKASLEYIKPGIITYFFALFLYTLSHFFFILKKTPLRSKDQPTFEEIADSYQLSKREKEVFSLLLEGKTNQEIANTLYISVPTVKSHTNHIFQKSGSRNRLELFAKSRLRT
jgi:DNA-binding CsgD family transcriptional regulator/heme/copper-type cytochrome/quinol oxidase subunit 4